MKHFHQIMLVLFVFLLPLQTVQLLREPIINGEKWQYGTIGIYATDVLLGISALLLLLNVIQSLSAGSSLTRRLKLAFTRNRLVWLFSLFALLWTGLSMLWAPDAWLAGYMVVKFLLAGGVFVLIREMVRYGWKRWIVWAVIASTLLQAIIGIGQFVTQETFSSTFIGMSEHVSWQAGTSVLKNESGRWLRAYGTLPHPNMYGLLIAIGLFFAFTKLIEGSNLRFGRSERVTLLSIVPILLLSLLVSFSRLAWVGFVLGSMAFLIMHWKEWDKPARERTLAILMLLSISGFIFIGLLRDTVIPRFDHATIAQEESITDRQLAFEEGWKIYRDYPWIGTGAGNYTTELMTAYSDRPVWDNQPAHSIPLLILVELGIIGFLLSFVLVVCLFKYASGTLLIPVSLLLLPSFFLDHFLWTSHFGILLFFLLIGLSSKRQ